MTFVEGGHLFEVGDVSTRPARCLTAVDPADTGPLRWSPNGERVLLGGATVVDATGTRPSGYFAENRDVDWSAPSGKALIAPSVNDGTLVWRSSTDSKSRIDVSFLAETTAAAYHPAGRAIIAAGTTEDGRTGIYLASNRGKDRKELAVVDDPATTAITEVAFNSDGGVVEFLHQHAGFYHVHQLQIPGLQLVDLVEEPGTADRLTVSDTDRQTVAWRRTTPDGQVTVRISFDGSAAVDAVAGAGAQGSTLEPVGWLPVNHLVVLEHPAGSPDGPGRLWIVSQNQSAQQLASGVERAAVRTIHGEYNELPTDIAEQAPG